MSAMADLECEYFCTSVGRIVIHTSDCDGLGTLISDEGCACSESPLNEEPTCLETLCSPQQFNNFLNSEVARCGTGAFSSLSSEAEPTSTAAPSSLNSIVATSVISSTNIILPTTTSGDGTTQTRMPLDPPAQPHQTSDANITHSPSSSSSLGGSSFIISPTSVDGTNSSAVNTPQLPSGTTSGNTVSGLSSHSAPLNGTIAPSESLTSNTAGFSTSSSISTLSNTVVTPSSSIGTNVGGGATSGSPRHTPHAVVIALLVASAVFFVTATLCLYKAKKRRSRETSDMTLAACVPEPRSTEQHWTDVADVPLVDDYEPHLITPRLSIYIPPVPSMITSPSAHRDASAQGYRSPALDSISSPSVTDDFPHCLSDEKVTGDTPASPASPSVCTPRDQVPQQDPLHRRGSDAPITPESTPLAYERHIASFAPNPLLATSAPSSSLRSPALPVSQSNTPAYDTRVIIESRRSVLDADGTGGQERVVMLPWPLGERLLAILESTPQRQYGPGELESTRVSSEELPAYAPRE